MSQVRSEPADQLASHVNELLRSHSALVSSAIPGNAPGGAAAGRVNNSLQALVNLFYLIAREARLEPHLQPLVTQIQAELAQLSRCIHRLGPHSARPIVEKEQ